jgi:hypothetical protein
MSYSTIECRGRKDGSRTNQNTGERKMVELWRDGRKGMRMAVGLRGVHQKLLLAWIKE